jgi:hypothetical protein
MHDEFPGPIDMVLFSNILHDWPEETNLNLIQKAYHCLCPGGRIVISELLLLDHLKFSTSPAISMNVIKLPYQGVALLAQGTVMNIDPHVTNLMDD